MKSELQLLLLAVLVLSISTGCKKEGVDFPGSVKFSVNDRIETEGQAQSFQDSSFLYIVVGFVDDQDLLTSEIRFRYLSKENFIQQSLQRPPQLTDNIALSTITQISGGHVTTEVFYARAPVSKIRLSSVNSSDITLTFDSLLFLREREIAEPISAQDTIWLFDGEITAPLQN